MADGGPELFKLKSSKYFAGFLCSLFVFVNGLLAQTSNPFKSGEMLKYSAWFNFIKGGESELYLLGIEEINGKPVYHVRSVTKSVPFFDRFYKVRDIMDSWIDTSTQVSYRFQKSLREGNYRKKYSVDFDYGKGLAVSEDARKAIPDIVHDGLSMIYYVRSKKIEIGNIFKINFFDNDSLRPFLIEVKGTEIVKVPFGKVECYVLAPYLESGKSLKHKSKVTIYLSTDKNRIPVMISNEARFGSLILKLEAIESVDQ